MPMQPDAIMATIAHRRAYDGNWARALLVLGATWLVLVAAFHRDWLQMLDQWWNSSTFNHILLLPPILVWLVWQRRAELTALRPTGWWPALVPFVAAMLLWLAGSFTETNLLRQAGAVGLLMASVPAILGPKVALGLLFPLFYMIFLVPFGDELVPGLQMVTADITIALTHLSGIPAEIDGVFIDTPVGLFEVAEACSGVKFLVAMVALGTLVAHLCFRSRARRAVFMAVAVIVPILANGIRAWGTIYLAQSMGVEWAAGFDHIVYGWVFFAVVMALVLGLAWRFFDRRPDEAAIDAVAIQTEAITTALQRSSWPVSGVVAGMAAIALSAILWANAAARVEAPMPIRIDLPDVAGWSRVAYDPPVWWEPRAAGADHRLLGRYADESGHTVDVFYALYRDQREGREATGFGEGALMPDSAWRWLRTGDGGEWLQAEGRYLRYTLSLYRHGDVLTDWDARLRLAVMADRAALRAEPTGMLILSAEGRDGPEAVAAFRRSAVPLGQWMDHIAAGE